MSITRHCLLLAATGLFLSGTARCQVVDSMMNLYATQFQQEKIHVQFDKSLYNKGETIWFKAYLMAGNLPSDYSTNFYADWYSPSGRLLQHTAFPVFESSAKGQFDIPEGYTEHSVLVRAYTRWMLNFDSAFLFRQEIPVYQPSSGKRNNTQATTILNFFPEGGDLVNGISSNLAFLATDQHGYPAEVRGAIKKADGGLVDSFATQRDGMGSLLFEPTAGIIYTAYWADAQGHSGSTALPEAKQEGAVLQAAATAGKVLVEVKRSAGAGAKLKQLYLVAHSNQEALYRSKLNLGAGSTAIAEIATEKFPSGVLQITLFNADWQPVAERIVFVNNHDYSFGVNIKDSSGASGKRGRRIFDIEVPDTLSSNLSVSVTDAGLYEDSSANIISQLLLCGEIRGYVHHPAYYFSGTADSLAQQLDLVMLTHGWRRYRWDEVMQGKLPVLKYARETDYLQIKGNVDAAVKPGQLLTLLVQAKDSSKRLLFAPVEQNGNFVQGGLLFFDTAKIFYRLTGEKRADKMKISFGSSLLPPIRFSLWNVPDNRVALDSPVEARSAFFAREQRKISKDVAILQEVTVYAKQRTITEALDRKYATGAFADETRYSFDISNDASALGSLDLFRYLQSRVTGLDVSYSSSADKTAANITADPQSQFGGPVLTWRNEHPLIYLNEMPSDVDAVWHLPMTDIVYVKVFPPPFFGAWQGGPGGAIAVYTRKGGERLSAGTTDFVQIPGYTRFREFYSPRYPDPAAPAEDARTTLYWNPYVLTGGNHHTVHVEFYNNDISSSLRVVVEGMNAAGRLARIEKILP